MYARKRNEFANDEFMHVCMHAFLHVFVYERMHVCMCVSIWDESGKDQEARGDDFGGLEEEFRTEAIACQMKHASR